MAASKSSPSRRKSISVTSENRPPPPARRRRAHSVAPGAPLSPAAKARRSLAPRKSILKASINVLDDESPDDATQSMDITRDFRTGMMDNNTRKSLGRRVSFASHAQVRLFEKPESNTNDSATPQSSPVLQSGDMHDVSRGKENDLPGATFQRRRSSGRHSIGLSEGGEESMDMELDDTAYGPAAFLQQPDSFAGGDAVDDDDDELDEEDMEMTEALPHIQRRRSSVSRSSLSRRPLADVPLRSPSPPRPSDHSLQESEQSFLEEMSRSSDGDISQPMEFTIPLERPPEPPSEAWLALRAVTHSGDTPYEPPVSDEDENGDEGMELTDAVARLMAVRNSLGIGADVNAAEDMQDETFTSTEDSFERDAVEHDENQTINVTGLMRRASIATDEVDGPSNMDTFSVYVDTEGSREELIHLPLPGPSSLQSGTSHDDAPSSNTRPTEVEQMEEQQLLSQSTRPNVFSALPPSSPPKSKTTSASQEQSQPQATTPRPFNFSFTPRARTPTLPSRPPSHPTSPSKAGTPSKPTFTAAFAPPVARPSPKKRSEPDRAASETPAETLYPEKKFVGTSRQASAPPLSISQQLLPGKRAQFSELSASQAPTASSSLPGGDPINPKRASLGFRRPSGYFAQRKSLSGAETSSVEAGERASQQPNWPQSPRNLATVGPGGNDISLPSEGDVDVLQPVGVGVSDSTSAEEHLNAIETIVEATSIFTPAHEQPQLPPRNSAPQTSPRALEPLREGYARPISPGHNAVETLDDMNVDAPDEIVNPAQQWREEVREDANEDNEQLRISIEQFFEMTGIRFMDELAAPRRSTIHPSSFRPAKRSSTDGEIPLAEYAVAMAVDLPQLELYTHVSKDLQAWIERIKTIFKEADEEALKMTPELFSEFVAADEEGQAELLHQLKLIKVNSHEQAKSEWYDWKLRWVQQLQEKADEGFNDLEKDAATLEEFIQRGQEILPALREEYEQVMRELEQEQADVAEIENCDQDFLNELKATIAEQSAELEAFRADVAEGNAKLERLQEQLDEIESEKTEIATAISEAERISQIRKNGTMAEVLRLKEELDLIEDIHNLHVTKIQSDFFEFVFATLYRVSVPCVEYHTQAEQLEVTFVSDAKTKYKDPFPQLSDLMLNAAKPYILSTGTSLNARQIVMRFGFFWSSWSHIVTQLRLVAVKFPVSIEVDTSTADGARKFAAVAMVMFPAVKGKAFVSFILDAKTFSEWPMSISLLQCDVKVAYGRLERDVLLKAVTGRLAEASPAYNHGCLLDACMEALEKYS